MPASFIEGDVVIAVVRRVGLTIAMLRLVLREADVLGVAEEVPVRLRHVQLGVAQCEAVHLTQERIPVLVLGGSRIARLTRSLIGADAGFKHLIVDEPRTTDGAVIK